jgi:valyl-tRNA synthetase
MTTKNKQAELATTYSSKEVEEGWYEIWENGGYFKPKAGKANETYSIVMPPPNVTGKLHAGHALDVTTQDTLIRFKRMKGFETLWLPGMDHAGIATQSVVEKMLKKTEGKKKNDYTREEFLEKVWAWKNEYGGLIAEQQRCMGASADQDYFLFTMDKEANEAVNHFFVKLYNEGLIYQSDYIINWDPKLESAISDAEVEHKDVKGAFYHILYQVVDSDIKIEIATTRPETMLGDTAISVHPDDPRYKDLIGKKAIIPIINKEIPIIADDYVDMELGTGCLKVTPGHDFNDFEIGRRHNLPIVNILNKNGTLNENAGDYKGLTCTEARKEIIAKLEELEILVAIKDHTHPVGHGDRSGAIIEPMVSKQWFLKVDDMAADSVKMIENETTRFYPKGWENTYFSWMREPKDWCISRQLWWGHRIPVFDCKDCGHQWASEEDTKDCPKCNSNAVEQDPDVLDTWFSSGLWPMSTLGWPNAERMNEKGFDRFFPTSTLVTGYDIIFFWVARMMMMALKVQNSIPFKHIYIHAIVRDKVGRKMSKSLNNGIDPLETIDEYGADAFRFTLAAGSGYNRNLNLDPARIGGYRNFINKIWNAFRFIHPFIDKSTAELPSTDELDHHERWILSELNTVSKEMNISMDEYRFDDACSSIYQFIFEKFCSWFIELSKSILHGDDEKTAARRATVLRHCFRKIVALLHPVAPYITEELWLYLKEEEEDLLIVQDYPEYDENLNFEKDQKEMNDFIGIVTHVRNLRASLGIKPKDNVKIELFSDDKNSVTYFENHKKGLCELAKADSLTIASKSQTRPAKSAMAATALVEIFLPLEGIIDLDQEITRMEKEIQKAEGGLKKYDAKLSNKNYSDNATAHVLDEVKSKAQDLRDKIESIQTSLNNFKS